MYFHFTLFKNIPAGKAKRKAGLRKNKSLPLGPFIRGKIRRVLHTTRTVPFTIYTSLSYLRREQLVSMVRVLFLLLTRFHVNVVRSNGNQQGAKILTPKINACVPCIRVLCKTRRSFIRSFSRLSYKNRC